MHFSQDIKIISWHNQGQVHVALRELGSTYPRLSTLWHSSLPFPLSPFCLSAAEGKPKAPTTHGASSAALKQRCQEPKMPFLQQCHLLWLGLGLVLGACSDVSQGVSLKKQKENFFAALPSAWVFPLGNLLPFWMYKIGYFGGGWGVWVCSLFKVQMTRVERSQRFMGKEPWPTLAFMGEEECESKIKFM